MNSLTEGPYRLRYVPPNETQVTAGLYATRVDGIGNPITAIARNHSLVDNENWWFSKAFDKHWFIVSQGPLPKLAGHGPVSLGFSHGVVKQGSPIILAAGLGEYDINPLDNDEFTITVAQKDGIETTEVNYIGTSNSGTLELQAFTIQTGGQTAVPKWAFEKVE